MARRDGDGLDDVWGWAETQAKALQQQIREGRREGRTGQAALYAKCVERTARAIRQRLEEQDQPRLI